MTGDLVRVELFFNPAVKERVTESHLGTAEVVTLASGHTRVVLNVEGWKELVPRILGWRPEVEVVSPPELRTHVADLLKGGASLYFRKEELH